MLFFSTALITDALDNYFGVLARMVCFLNFPMRVRDEYDFAFIWRESLEIEKSDTLPFGPTTFISVIIFMDSIRLRPLTIAVDPAYLPVFFASRLFV